MNLNEYAELVHEANKKWWVCTHCTKGWVTGYGQLVEGDTTPIKVTFPCQFCNGFFTNLKRNVGELIALMHSELSEALEGDRKGLKDDKLPQYDMEDVEMVDCMIRILDFLGQKKVDVEKIFRDKMEFNRVREDHKLESRMKEGGKRY